MVPQTGFKRLRQKDLEFEASLEYIAQGRPKMHSETPSPNKQASQEH